MIKCVFDLFFLYGINRWKNKVFFKCRGAKLPCELSSSEVIFEKFSLDVENQFFIFEAIGADWTDWLGCLVMLKTHMCLKLPLLLIFYIFSVSNLLSRLSCDG